MHFASIEFGSAAYEQAWQLRQRVLRAPLSLTLTDADRRQDSGDWHFGLFDYGQLAACVSATEQPGACAKIRQMAVEPQFQGRGLGSQLMLAVEKELRAQGVAQVVLHARATATAFYAKLGYHAQGECFKELAIDHVKMHKRLDGACG